MAYYLQFDGTNDYVTVSMAATSAESWSLEWKLFAIPTPDGFGFARLFGGSAPNISNDRVSTQIGGGDVSTRFNGVTKIWSGLTFTNTDTFRITYNGAQLELFINDVSRGAIAGTVATNFQIIGANSNAYTNLALQYAKFTNTTTPSKSRDYQPSLSNGTGNSLPDAANSVNGTLVNFTAVDADKWKFYSAGGANQSNVSYDVGEISYSVSANSTSISKSADVSYDVGAISFDVSANQTTPNYQSTLNYDIGAIDFSVISTVQAPSYTAAASYDIGGISYSVSANTGAPLRAADVLYDIGAVDFSISASQVAPQYEASAEYDIGSIDFSVSANTGAPIRAATAGYDIGAVSYSLSASSVAPAASDIEANIGYDIGSIGYSVFVLNGVTVSTPTKDSGISFKEPPNGIAFKEPSNGIQF